MIKKYSKSDIIFDSITLKEYKILTSFNGCLMLISTLNQRRL